MNKKQLEFVGSLELAAILGITQRRVNDLAKNGTIHKQDDGKFRTAEAVRAYYENKLSSDDEIDYLKEHARLEKLKADKEEIRLAKLRGELYEAQVVELTMQEIYTTLRTQLLGIPSKLAARLPENVRGQISEAMNQEIEGCLAEMSSYDPAMFVVEDADE